VVVFDSIGGARSTRVGSPSPGGVVVEVLGGGAGS
jgi:hypothetical protein